MREVVRDTSLFDFTSALRIPYYVIKENFYGQSVIKSLPITDELDK